MPIHINTPQRTKLLNSGLQDKQFLHVIGTGSFGTVVEGRYKGNVQQLFMYVQLNHIYR